MILTCIQVVPPPAPPPPPPGLDIADKLILLMLLGFIYGIYILKTRKLAR